MNCLPGEDRLWRTNYEGSATAFRSGCYQSRAPMFLLAQTRIQIGSYGVRVWTNIDGSVLRGRALEIVDSQGRIRASINSDPEKALFQLVGQDGRPSAEFETSERGGGLALMGDSEGTYVQLSGHGLKVTKDGHPQMIP